MGFGDAGYYKELGRKSDGDEFFGDRDALCSSKPNEHYQSENFMDDPERNELQRVSEDTTNDEKERRKKEKRKKRELKRYNDLKKDWMATNGRIDILSNYVKIIKALLTRQRVSTPVSDDEIDEYDELPLLPLRKVKRVRLMETNIGNNRAYKKQLVEKLREVGGEDVKKNVIKIFKLLFSTKLKTKMCWKGSTNGKGKVAFRDFTNILAVIRLAVKFRFKKCSADNIAAESKLRFKQAQKDYEREQEKQC